MENPKVKTKGRPPIKKCFLSGIARMRGVEAPARIKKTQYIYSFLTAEKDVQVARKRGRGGEVIWAMPERKHLFLNEVFPKTHPQSELLPEC